MKYPFRLSVFPSESLDIASNTSSPEAILTLASSGSTLTATAIHAPFVTTAEDSFLCK